MLERGLVLDDHTGRWTSLEPPETESQHAIEARWGTEQRAQTLSTQFRHSGWVRERRLVFEALHRTRQANSRLREFATCGSHAYVLRSLDDPGIHRVAGSSCHDRFCLPCAKERSHAIAANCIERIEGRVVRFLTLTVRSETETLAELLDKLYTGLQRLRRRRFWSRKVDGGVAFLEIKWNADKQRWHPHFHLLIEGRYIPQQRLKELWLEVTGDSHIVDIRLVRDLSSAAQYVTKYASKPFNNTFVNRPERLDEAIETLKGRKLCITFGTWRGVTLARPISDGAWETLGSLDNMIRRAAHGDDECRAILADLTDLSLADLYARAPPPECVLIERPPIDAQLTWFGVWQADGSVTHPNEF